MRVLIVTVSGLGEIVNALPVLDYLRQASPGIEVDWVVEEKFSPILEGNPLVSMLHRLRSRAWRGRPFAAETLGEISGLKQALKERDFDLVFDLQGTLKSGLVSWATGCRDRIGFEREELTEKANILFTTRRIPLRRQDRHVTERYLRLVSVPFARDFRAMTLATGIHTPPEDDANAEVLLATLSDGLVFLLLYGATRQTGLWSEQSWSDLGGALLERFPDSSVLFPWESQSERAAVTRIAGGIGRGARVLESFTLRGLTALLKRVDLVVGGDAGPVHLAAAVGTPTVSFHRSSDGKKSGPRGERHVVLQSPMHCTRCLRTHCDKDAECRDTIKVAAVLAGVEALISS